MDKKYKVGKIVVSSNEEGAQVEVEGYTTGLVDCLAHAMLSVAQSSGMPFDKLKTLLETRCLILRLGQAIGAVDTKEVKGASKNMSTEDKEMLEKLFAEMRAEGEDE